MSAVAQREPAATLVASGGGFDRARRRCPSGHPVRPAASGRGDRATSRALRHYNGIADLHVPAREQMGCHADRANPTRQSGTNHHVSTYAERGPGGNWRPGQLCHRGDASHEIVEFPDIPIIPKVHVHGDCYRASALHV